MVEPKADQFDSRVITVFKGLPFKLQLLRTGDSYRHGIAYMRPWFDNVICK